MKKHKKKSIFKKVPIIKINPIFNDLKKENKQLRETCDILSNTKTMDEINESCKQIALGKSIPLSNLDNQEVQDTTWGKNIQLEEKEEPSNPTLVAEAIKNLDKMPLNSNTKSNIDINNFLGLMNDTAEIFGLVPGIVKKAEELDSLRKESKSLDYELAFMTGKIAAYQEVISKMLSQTKFIRTGDES